MMLSSSQGLSLANMDSSLDANLENHQGKPVASFETLPSSGILPRTGLIFDERMLLHRDPEDDHPEQPLRLQSIMQRFLDTGLLSRCILVEPGDPPMEALHLTHSQDHLEFLANISKADVATLVDLSHKLDSLYLCPESEVSAKTAVTCTTSLACEIAHGRLANGFAIVRPPGHHAEPDKAMRFCLCNNVAVAVKELQRLGLAKRVMILDWDIHHGNGTEKIFRGDPNVLLVSIHRYDHGRFYPNNPEASPEYVGHATTRGNNVNIAWNGPGATDGDYLVAFNQVVMPIATEFGPDFVFVSAGFDAADGDPIGECKVTPRGFALMTHRLMELAAGRLLLVLEGGYNIPVVADSAEACLRCLLGEPIPLPASRSFPSTKALLSIETTIRNHSPFWTSIIPRWHRPTDDGQSVSLQSKVVSTSLPYHLLGVIDVFWSQLCRRSFNLIPLPLSDEPLRSAFHDKIHISENFFDEPECIVIFAHESGSLYSHSLETNIVDATKSLFQIPYQDYIQVASDQKYAILDINVASRKWLLKQTHTGSPGELSLLTDLMLYLWDRFISLADTLNVFFVSSGLPSYAICSLLDKRVVQDKVRGVAVLSPTLYLPVMSPDKSTWYSRNSLVVVPTRREAGSAIPTNASFGSCVSAGTDDSREFANVIAQSRSMVFKFIFSRIAQIESFETILGDDATENR